MMEQRSTHYRLEYLKMKAKCEAVKARKKEEKQKRIQTEEECARTLEDKEAILTESVRVIDEYKEQLKRCQMDRLAILKSHNELSAAVNDLERRLELTDRFYNAALADLAMMQTAAHQRDLLQSVNASLVKELRRRDAQHLDDKGETKE
jgi:hypothetical protein